MTSEVDHHGRTSRRRVSSRKSMVHPPPPLHPPEENKENMTADVGAMAGAKHASLQPGHLSKKKRSKSIGPGGLASLEEKPGDQRKRAAAPLIKSILKPTIPLSPLREIPTFPPARERTGAPGKAEPVTGTSDVNHSEHNLLIDFSVQEEIWKAPVSVSGAEKLHNPFDATVDVQAHAHEILRISDLKDGTQAHVPEVGDAELREKTKKEALERREARRKSLANRRVSFAPEATLHTWNVIEFVQDSTTSSASTNATARASLVSTSGHDAPSSLAPYVQMPSSDPPDAPSTPPRLPKDASNQVSPTQEQDSHRRKRRRRSSGNSSADVAGQSEGRHSLSPFSGSSAVGSDDTYTDTVRMADEDDSANAGSDSADGESTSMSLDETSITSGSLGSAVSSDPNTASTGRLDEALRQAAIHAGTQGIEYDENGDLSMEIAGDQVTAALHSWAKNRSENGQNGLKDLSSLTDQENQNPFSPAFKDAIDRDVPEAPNHAEEDDEADMEMTRPVGKIIAPQHLVQSATGLSRRASLRNSERRASLGWRRSSGEESSLGDATMDLTMALGSIEDEPGPSNDSELSLGSPCRSSGPSPIREVQVGISESIKHSPTSTKTLLDLGVPDESTGSIAQTAVEEKIHLQEFLDMTGIHFMDLTATKRKQHQIPAIAGNAKEDNADQMKSTAERDGSFQSNLEDRVKAASCTVPLLELYQHSCHELKKSISQGRNIIRQIEADTNADNPSLFREYISAPSEVRSIMDNQFKNVKTFARLTSKALWYDWRTNLLNDLRDGLRKILDGMSSDDDVLQKYEALVSTVLPHAIEDRERLMQEHAGLQAHADEIRDSNQAELGMARSDLLVIRQEIEDKMVLVEQKQMQVREKQEAIEEAMERKMTCIEEIRQAEMVREQCRGWTSTEVSFHKGIVDEFERQHGWTITGMQEAIMTMTFRRDLQVVCDTSAFGTNRTADGSQLVKTPALKLFLSETARERTPSSLRVITEAFMRATEMQVSSVPPDLIKISELLRCVSDSWQRANTVAEDFRRLSLHFPAEIHVLPKHRLLATSWILLPALGTKLEVTFELGLYSQERPSTVTVRPRATVIYGEQFKEAKMQKLLAHRVPSCLPTPAGQQGRSWITAVRELCDGLMGKDREAWLV